MSDVKKCQNCGNEFSDGLKCPECGQYADLLSDENADVCPHCGSKIVRGFMFCSSCKKRISEEETIEIPEKFDFSSLSEITSEETE